LRAGIDTDAEESALHRLVSRVKATWPQGSSLGSVKLDIGFFANVIDIGGIGLAISTDGVGSKALIAQMMQKYDTIGIDCVAMNVNDLVCVGARPLSLVDYVAVQRLNPDILDEIAKGLCEGAAKANISISGGETAQLREIINGARPGEGFDLAGTAVGLVDLNRIIVGQDIQEGDAVIGIESNGIHSNGLSLAREVLFEQCGYAIDAKLPDLDRTIGDELLKPTHIYVREVLDILEKEIKVKALIHITSDGFLNLVRVASDVGYVIDQLPSIPPIFTLIQNNGDVSIEEMFRVYNMGIGFCLVVPSDQAELTMSVVRSHQKVAHRIGYTVHDVEKKVFIRPFKLVGKQNKFFAE
jgi:phosphoribosylformylglycinamidine cyclo-ligase